MNRQRIDYDNTVEIIMATDTLFAMFYDEPYLDDSCEVEIQKLRAEYPLGLELIEYELIPNDYRAVVKAAPYIVDEFQAEMYLDLTNNVTCEIKIIGQTVSYRLVNNGIPSKVYTVPIQVSEYGLTYFSFENSDKSMIYLREFKKYG